MADRFVLTDERLNCYGFRTLTKGVQLKDFQKNPVMLYMHSRGLVIGKWEDIQVSKEDANVTAEPVFDLTDPFAAGIASKVEQKMLNACSAGLEMMAWSDKAEDLVAGQTRPTLTQSVLNEASIVDIPGNKNALRLNLGNGLWLSDDAAANADTLDKFLPTLTLYTPEKMEQILLTLGLAASATQAEAVAAIATLKLNHGKEKAELVISLAEKAGVIPEGMKDNFVLLANTAPELAIKFLDFAKLAAPAAEVVPALPGKDLRLADVVAGVTAANATQTVNLTAETDARAAWTMRQWETKDSAGLQALKLSNPTKWATMFEAQYGSKPTI